MALENLELYALIRSTSVKCYEVSNYLKNKREFNLADQLSRAALSIGNNFAEGYGRGATGERLMLMFYAEGSTQECKNCILAAADCKFIDELLSKELCALLGRISIGIIEFCAWILKIDPAYQGSYRERVEIRRSWRNKKRK